MVLITLIFRVALLEVPRNRQVNPSLNAFFLLVLIRLVDASRIPEASLRTRDRQDLGLRPSGFGFRVSGLGFRV